MPVSILGRLPGSNKIFGVLGSTALKPGREEPSVQVAEGYRHRISLPHRRRRSGIAPAQQL
ncbi:hypothetical protein GZL_08989 [Streptomyces sp. 769]|nr:hypothetical protein GZL_08989 [Streptomyces sp. 769]